MKTSVAAIKVRVTPKMAIATIEAHEKLVKDRGGPALNRNINDNLVSKYANDMRSGAWELNGETIKVASTGRILDGQHRLWAVANHDVVFDTMMVTGLDENAFYTIDIGRSRRPSDFMTVDGIPSASKVAAAARYVIAYRKNMLKNSHMIPSHEIVAFAKANTRMVESVSVTKSTAKVVSPSVAAAWHFLFSEASEDDAESFIEDLRDGIELERGDPVLALRERLIKNRSGKAKLASKEIFVLGFRAWNDRRGGKRRKMTKVMKHADEQLPRVA